MVLKFISRAVLCVEPHNGVAPRTITAVVAWAHQKVVSMDHLVQQHILDVRSGTKLHKGVMERFLHR